MAYTAPKTWSVAEVLTAANLNTHLRDNMIALKDPPSANYEPNEVSVYTVSAGAGFANVDGTNLSLAITTTGGDVMVHFHGTVRLGGAGTVMFNVTEDGTVVAADDGIVHVNAGTNRTVVAFTRLLTGVTAGSHTYNLQWKSVTAAATLYAGAGTSNEDTHPQFWAREVS